MTTYVGQILLVAFNFAPVGFLPCNGQLLSIQDNDTLFVLLGTTYGGDGVNTFGLPDLRGRAPVHAGSLAGGGTYPIGMLAGSESVTVTTSQLPSHNHAVIVNGNSGGTATANGNYIAVSGSNIYGTGTTVPMGATTTPNTGGSIPHENRQPSLAMQYVISLYGIFPSPN